MFVECLPSFFADFGVPAEIGDPPTTVTSIFDDFGEDSFGIVAAPAPVLLVATEELPAVVIGAPVSVNGTAYRLAAMHSDGTGLTRLMLK